MPLYEYDCAECKARFELLVATTQDADRARCPKCGSRKTERILSTFAAHSGKPSAALPRGGCGRCGDPSGPCALD